MGAARWLGAGFAVGLAAAAALSAGPAVCEVKEILGCYRYDGASIADLGLVAGGNVRSELLTHEACGLACWRLGLPLSAVADDRCLCGYSLTPEAVKFRASNGDCAAKKCPGNSTQACGGEGRLLAFGAACSGTRVPNMHGCIDEAARSLPYCDTTLPLQERLSDLVGRFDADELLAQITPQEDLGNTCTTFTAGKASIGLPMWLWLVETNTNVASGCIQEGRCATTFIGPNGLGASFNRTVWRLKGSVLGTEMRALSNIGASRFQPDGRYPIGLTGFGPNINIARDPRFGRNSELPGEDPLLSGTYAFEMVSGMQEPDNHGYPKMAAFLKHFAAYSTEANRGHDTYDISMFDFFDTYLPQFKHAFEAQPKGVMCSYNAENGHPSCANDWLLNKQLRSWKPDALVTTDCGAVPNLRGAPVEAADDTTAAAMTLMNGTDLEMGSTLFNNLTDAVKRGLATNERVLEAVKRAFQVHFQLGRFDPPELSEWSSLGLDSVNSSLHQQISYEAALQGLVLLKNDGVLPLRQGATVAVVGPQAAARAGLLSSYAADQQCYGGDDHCIGTIAEGIALANTGGQVVVEQGVEVNSNRTDRIDAALAAVRSAEVVVLALGIDKSVECEAQDRQDTRLPGLQESFAQMVLALNKPTVLVLTNGGALAIDALVARAGEANAGYAIVEAFNPAVVGGRALGASLFGLENRWGKLPITMYPHSYITEQDMTNYDMAKAPGRTYRYYQGRPLFPFGFGLSLTTFAQSCAPVESPPEQMVYECEVKNTGNLDGEEVLQVYHRAADIGKVDHPLPKRALIAFERVSVPKGGSLKVSFAISRHKLQVVTSSGEKALYPGKHELIFSRGIPEEEQVFSVIIPQGTEIVV